MDQRIITPELQNFACVSLFHFTAFQISQPIIDLSSLSKFASYTAAVSEFVCFEIGSGGNSVNRFWPYRKMLPLRHFIIYLVLCYPFLTAATSGNESIYDILKLHGLPMGLLPEGVTNFSVDDSGKFQVHLDRACDAKFESELHYDVNVTGTLRYGEIIDVSGISAQDLFLWLPVVEIRVDIPSSGLIYFNVTVVSKQFSLSSFETPRKCLTSPDPDLQGATQISKILSKILFGKIWCIFSSLNGGKLAIL